MPNWCHNRVSFHLNSEDEKEKEKFRNFINVISIGDYKYPEDVFDFDRIVPMPEELRNACTTICTQEEYDNWKPTGDVNVIEDDDYIIVVQFDTAWGPSEGIYNAIIEKIKEEGWDISVSWFYDEPGMEFAGYLGS